MTERICPHCGKLGSFHGTQKYHKECAIEVNRLRTEKSNAKRRAIRLIKLAYGEEHQRNQPEAYDVTTNGLTGIEGLAQAVVEQAIADWRYLCDDGTETKWCNFVELEQFFKHKIGLFVRSDNGAEERIWELMQRERMLAGK